MNFDSIRGDKDLKNIKKRTLKESDVTTKEVFHHEESMDQMFKAIELTRMSEGMKSLLKLRLRGYNTVTIQSILLKQGVTLGASIESLERMEQEAKDLVMETLKKFSMSDIIGKVNSNKKMITSLKSEFSEGI